MMYRRVGGRNERYAESAAELVRFKVDIMLRRQPRLGGKARDIRHPNRVLKKSIYFVILT